jgi:hypothetical protein
MRKTAFAAPLFLAPLLAGCAVAPPAGPDVMVLPGPGVSYQQFQQDDYECRSVAANSIGGGAQAATNNAVGTAVAGTAVGAAAGALIGAAAGNAGAGAAIGAGTGLAVGASAGAANAQASGADLQWRYDATYAQCMGAKGNQVPPMPAQQPDYTYPYLPYPPYAYYPGYGYLYPPVIFTYGFGWGWHDRVYPPGRWHH